jgi:hypothetical protein
VFFAGKISIKKCPLTRVSTLFLILAFGAMPDSAVSQFSGHNSKGDYGMFSGTQSPPGWYLAAPMFYRYSAPEFRDRNGDPQTAIEHGGSTEANALLLGAIWVSEHKVLGGNYSFVVFPGVTNNALGFPPTGVDTQTSSGLADLYVQPINLGWTTSRADFIAGVGVFAPTGEFEAGGESNRGLGMWSYELFAGTTLYFDEARTWSFAATAFYETHGKKDGTDIRVGDILTLEGGLGKSFMQGAASAGIAYYGQWKISDDDFGVELPTLPNRRLGRSRVYGIGPELTVPLATKKALYGLLNLRYFWETGARSALQGNTFVATMSFPVPSIPLP